MEGTVGKSIKLKCIKLDKDGGEVKMSRVGAGRMPT
jgi:hypothetical protein